VLLLLLLLAAAPATLQCGTKQLHHLLQEVLLDCIFFLLLALRSNVVQSEVHKLLHAHIQEGAAAMISHSMLDTLHVSPD